MYESFYGFTARPFLAVPVTSRYFPASSIESARENLIRCMERAEGCGLVMGPSGSGVSLLCQVIAEHFEPQIETLLLGNLRLTNSREMLQAILYKMGIPYQKLADGELRLAIMDALSTEGRCPQGILLIVDEAHLLSARLFEELRFMTNTVRDAKPGVRLLVAGESSLEERFAHPRLSQINQRVAVRCYLHAFSAEESYQFIRAQTDAAGTNPDRLWAMDALRAIHRYTDGCPRLINQLCNHALLLAAQATVPQLGEGEIELAWSDFQQLPTAKAMSVPASETPESSGQVIEFGSLDEAASDSTPLPTPSHADTEQTAAAATVESVDSVPAASESTEALFPETESGTEPGTEPGTKEVELNHSIVCQNQMADETTENQKQHDALFDPHESPAGEPAYPNPPEQNTHPTGVSVTDFVGIDAEHIVQLSPESTDKPETVPSEPEAAVETEAQQASDAPIWTVHQEPHTVAAAKDDSPRAASTDFAAQPPPGKTHPLIPLQSRVISELICELQETHLFENDALKNLVQR